MFTPRQGNRGGTQLDFHLQASEPVVQVQVHVNGQDLFVPFGVMVK